MRSRQVRGRRPPEPSAWRAPGQGRQEDVAHAGAEGARSKAIGRVREYDRDDDEAARFDGTRQLRTREREQRVVPEIQRVADLPGAARRESRTARSGSGRPAGRRRSGRPQLPSARAPTNPERHSFRSDRGTRAAAEQDREGRCRRADGCAHRRRECPGVARRSGRTRAGLRARAPRAARGAGRRRRPCGTARSRC